MADMPSISRRRALAAIGAATIGIGSYVAGVRSADSMPDRLAGRNCAPSPLATSPTDWPFPRHDRANTGHAPARAGPDWPLEQVWEQKWPVGDIYNLRSLVVADGVAVTLVEGDPGSILLALSLVDGTVLWQRPVRNARYGQVSTASGMAFVQGDVSDSPTRFAARSVADGTALWTDSFRTHVPQTVVDGRLLSIDRSPDRSRNEDHFAVTARDARTGVKCWRAVHEGQPQDIGVANGLAILPTRDHGVLALDPASGDQQWRSDAGGDTAAIGDGRVISQRFPGDLRALSLADGSTEWHIQSEHFLEGGEDDEGRQYARPGFKVGAVTSEAVIYMLEVYSDYPGRLQARDLETGELLWDVGPEPIPVEFHGYSRPVVIGDDVLVVRYARREYTEEPPDALLRLDVASGTEIDSVAFSVEDRVYPPVTADNTLLVPKEERLVAYT